MLLSIVSRPHPVGMFLDIRGSPTVQCAKSWVIPLHVYVYNNQVIGRPLLAYTHTNINVQIGFRAFLPGEKAIKRSFSVQALFKSAVRIALSHLVFEIFFELTIKSWYSTVHNKTGHSSLSGRKLIKSNFSAQPFFKSVVGIALSFLHSFSNITFPSQTCALELRFYMHGRGILADQTFLSSTFTQPFQVTPLLYSWGAGVSQAGKNKSTYRHMLTTKVALPLYKQTIEPEEPQLGPSPLHGSRRTRH